MLKYKIKKHILGVNVVAENMCRQPSIKYGSFDPVQTSYDVNDKVTFSCDDGFRLEGANMISCRSDGSWSAKFPTCERKSNVAGRGTSQTKPATTDARFFCSCDVQSSKHRRGIVQSRAGSILLQGPGHFLMQRRILSRRSAENPMLGQRSMV